MKKVTQERYEEALEANGDRTFALTELSPFDISILHGVLKNLIVFNDVGFSDVILDMAKLLKQKCLDCFSEMGFSDDEVEYLDAAYDEGKHIVRDPALPPHREGGYFRLYGTQRWATCYSKRKPAARVEGTIDD